MEQMVVFFPYIYFFNFVFIKGGLDKCLGLAT